MTLRKDFTDLLCELSLAGVEFLVIGGYAMAVHGHPRYTGDLDLFYRDSPENVDRMVKALKAFGLPKAYHDPERFLAEETVNHVGYEPNRVDFLNSISAVRFEAAWQARKEVEVDGVPSLVPFIGLADLIENKIASGRPQDMADVNKLVKTVKAMELSSGKKRKKRA